MADLVFVNQTRDDVVRALGDDIAEERAQSLENLRGV